MIGNEARAHDSSRSAREQAGEAAPWLDGLSRLGYASVGSVYALVGVLAALAALGAGGGTTDPKGVLGNVVRSPVGRPVLALTVVGLVGYMIWQLVLALLDPERHGRSAKGLLMRGGNLFTAGLYASLSTSAFQVLRQGRGNGDSDDAARGWTARLLMAPMGRWLVVAAGLVLLGVGVYQARQAFTARFRDDLCIQDMTSSQATCAVALGRTGYAARAVIFAIVSVFLMLAARDSRPGQARGLDGALDALLQRPAGPWLLLTVSAGLLSYGLFMLFQAAFRRMLVRR